MRNSAPVTIAPTGTISIIAGAASGIEPLFALSYVRNVMDRTRLVEGNAYFEAVARHEGFYSAELMERLAETGSLDDLDGVPGWVKDVFRVSHDIHPRWHVRMQAAFQEYTDNAVSKTINFPHDASVADVAEAYQSAYALGCKGITVYRDGSKAEQVLSAGATATAAATTEAGPPVGDEAKPVVIEVPGPPRSAPAPPAHSRHHGARPHRTRQYVCNREPGRRRPSLRGVRDDGQGGRLRCGAAGGGVAAGVAGAAGGD